MSKKNQRRKVERRTLEEARRITVGKIVRLLLKSFGFAILLTLVVMVLQALHVPAIRNFWVQMGMVFVAYLIVYPVLMSEFRPRRKRRGAEEEA
jgi:purine-cytosine permease-like protein